MSKPQLVARFRRSLVPTLNLGWILTSVAGFSSGCAGPHTPLGAVWTWKPLGPIFTDVLRDPAFADPNSASNSPDLKIQFKPSRQVLHAASPWRIQIEDLRGDLEHSSLKVRYQGLDVTETFLRRARMRQFSKDRTLLVEAPFLRLDATQPHSIEVSYQSSTGGHAAATFEPPTCSILDASRKALHTGEFEVSAKLLAQIAEAAGQAGFNPSLFTGLVAQESRFKPKTVSWAKALGLTQITTSAEMEIARAHPEWPRYPEMAQLSVAEVQRLILLGNMNARNEWRLDPALSLLGGVEYTRWLTERWSSPEAQEAIRRRFREPEVAFTQLVLASYHSGYARVMGAFVRRGQDWLSAPELKEARKYVNRIFSYCHHFGEPIFQEEKYAQAS